MTKFPYNISVCLYYDHEGDKICPQYTDWLNNYPLDFKSPWGPQISAAFNRHFGLTLSVDDSGTEDYVIINNEEDELRFSAFLLEYSYS